MGKTSFVLNIAQHIGIEAGKTVGIFSLEMSKEQLFMRMLTSEARVDAHRFRGGFLGEQDYGRLVDALARLHDAQRVHRRHAVGRHARDARQGAPAQAEHGLDMLIVDYLQLMQGAAGSRAASRNSRPFRASLKDSGQGTEDSDPGA